MVLQSSCTAPGAQQLSIRHSALDALALCRGVVASGEQAAEERPCVRFQAVHRVATFLNHQGRSRKLGDDLAELGETFRSDADLGLRIIGIEALCAEA